MINLKVDLGENSYPIFIGNEILKKLGEMLEIYGFGPKAVVITDTNVHKLYAEEISGSLTKHLDFVEFISLPAGEKSKSFATIENILTQMLKFGCDRSITILAFGGGVVGDIAGFVASIYKRGVRYIQVPTTLLAQVDSSIGGKTGVNHPLGKNQIGTIYQPKMVWSDLALLKSLPRREILCGLGEIIKYGIIKDTELFTLIEENLQKIILLDSFLVQKIVKRCCEIKAEVVAQDERESGLRMILNFGHTIAHAIEATMGYKKIWHGEAVLLGILAESKIALDCHLIDQEDFNRVTNLIGKFDLLNKVKRVEFGELLTFVKADKKAVGGKSRLVLPKKIGEVEIYDDIDQKLIKNGIQYLVGEQP